MLRFKNKFVLIWPSSHEYCISVNHVSLIMAARVSAVQYYVWSLHLTAVLCMLRVHIQGLYGTLVLMITKCTVCIQTTAFCKQHTLIDIS